MSERPSRRRLATLVLVVAAVLATTVAPASAATDATEPAFVVGLHPDGDATVTVVYTFDLTTANESEAFEQLRNDTRATNAYVDRFGSRMRSVAAGTSDAVQRNVTVTDASAEFDVSGSTGVVRLSATLENLAAVEDDRLVLSEPFASGFSPDREFRVAVPDGYEVTSATPNPTETGSPTVYAAGSDLTDFELVAAPASSDTTAAESTTTSGSGPGFGAVATLLALAALLVGVLPRQ